jgi:hypothetical protein
MKTLLSRIGILVTLTLSTFSNKTYGDQLNSVGNFLGSNPRTLPASQEVTQDYNLDMLRHQWDDLHKPDFGEAFRLIDGETNCIFETKSGFIGMRGKVTQTLSDGILLKTRDVLGYEEATIFVARYPFQTVDDQIVPKFFAKPAGVFTYTTTTNARRTIKKYDYGISVSPSDEMLHAELISVSNSIANHPSVLAVIAKKEATKKDLEKRYSKAFNYYYTKAKDQNDANAQYQLATFYLNGQGCETNREQGFYWLKKSAENGSIEASNKLVKLNPK